MQAVCKRRSKSAAGGGVKALAREQVGLRKQLTQFERQLTTLKRKPVNSYDGVNTVLVQALSDEITQLSLQIGVVKSKLEEIDETRSSFVKVSAQIDESLGLVSLIEKQWKDEDYTGLRRSLRVLVKEVDNRPEGAHIVLRPLVVLDKAGYDNRGGTSPNGNNL